MNDSPSSLIFTETLKGGLSQLTFIRPFGKGHFGHQCGFHPMDPSTFPGAGWIDEGRLRLLKFLEAGVKFFKGAV